MTILCERCGAEIPGPYVVTPDGSWLCPSCAHRTASARAEAVADFLHKLAERECECNDGWLEPEEGVRRDDVCDSCLAKELTK